MLRIRFGWCSVPLVIGVRLWDGLSGRLVRSFAQAHEGAPVLSVQFTRNTKVRILYSSTFDSILYSFSFHITITVVNSYFTLQCIHSTLHSSTCTSSQVHTRGQLTLLVCSLSPQYLLSSGKDAVVRLWDLRAASCLISYTGAGAMSSSMDIRCGALFNQTEDFGTASTLRDSRTIV